MLLASETIGRNLTRKTVEEEEEEEEEEVDEVEVEEKEKFMHRCFSKKVCNPKKMLIFSRKKRQTFTP